MNIVVVLGWKREGEAWGKLKAVGTTLRTAKTREANELRRALASAEKDVRIAVKGSWLDVVQRSLHQEMHGHINGSSDDSAEDVGHPDDSLDLSSDDEVVGAGHHGGENKPDVSLNEPAGPTGGATLNVHRGDGKAPPHTWQPFDANEFELRIKGYASHGNKRSGRGEGLCVGSSAPRLCCAVLTRPTNHSQV